MSTTGTLLLYSLEKSWKTVTKCVLNNVLLLLEKKKTYFNLMIYTATYTVLYITSFHGSFYVLLNICDWYLLYYNHRDTVQLLKII